MLCIILGITFLLSTLFELLLAYIDCHVPSAGMPKVRGYFSVCSFTLWNFYWPRLFKGSQFKYLHLPTYSNCKRYFFIK
uniref:Secreted protein n=1 Tax=Gorilla gorilla gorilla TaxID=9595 RepID=G3SH38_GORGO